MRLWVKFLSILAVAIALQAWLGANAQWVDEAWFAVRVGLHNLVPGADPNDASMMAAADALADRANARSLRASHAAGAGAAAMGTADGSPAGADCSGATAAPERPVGHCLGSPPAIPGAAALAPALRNECPAKAAPPPAADGRECHRGTGG